MCNEQPLFDRNYVIITVIGTMSLTVPRLHHLSRSVGSFYNFFRLDEQLFDLLLTKVTPAIRRCDTHLRCSISPRDRLAVTLRYLATGNSMADLHYTFRIGKNIFPFSRFVCNCCIHRCPLLQNMNNPASGTFIEF